jgi:DinB family protein
MVVPTLRGRDQTRLATASADHRAAIREYVAAAARIPTSVWVQPPGPGKWSPAQVTEHVALAIESMREEARGAAPLPVRVPAWRRMMIRLQFLPGILRQGTFPEGARAPREIRPSNTPVLQADALERLTRAASDLEKTVLSPATPAPRYLTHPYFGRLSIVRAVRFLEVHARHHLGQLPRHE